MIKTGLQVLNDGLQLSAEFGKVITLKDAKLALLAEQTIATIATVEQYHQDLSFLEEMLSSHDRGDAQLVRRMLIDWRDDLERKISDLKHKLK